MASGLSCPGGVVLFLAYLGICYTELTTADRRQPHLNIFHHSCALKRDEGPCKALKERFYFDTDTRRCESFEYGGCQGNANNFESLEACEEMCVVTANKSPCHLEDEPGPCRGLVPRYFFNSKTRACQRFFYGGCFGNANNFKTIQSCQDTCQRRNDTQERRDDPEPGEVVKPTTETLIKDDKDSAALVESERQLQPKPESHAVFFLQDCLSSIDKGHCEGSEKRYAYNRATKRCEAFYYGGCGGNKNNFVLRKHCIKACRPDHSRRKQIRIKTRKSHILLQSA